MPKNVKIGPHATLLFTEEQFREWLLTISKAENVSIGSHLRLIVLTDEERERFLDDAADSFGAHLAEKQ